MHLPMEEESAKYVPVRADAGEMRVKLSNRAIKHMRDGDASCYSELWPLIKDDVVVLAGLIGEPAAYVFACTIDDIDHVFD